MSVLAAPHLYFKGQMAWDPIVTNNYPQLYDENVGQTVFSEVSDAVDAFRQEAISWVNPSQGNWNPHGTYRSEFFETTVTGYDIGNGLETNDPFVNSAVNLKAMLVDLEPYGSISSQLYFDDIRFGVDGGYCIFAPRTSRFTDRYINFVRNTSGDVMIAGVASVIWQTSFPKDGLKIEACDSPFLKTLNEALKDDDVLGLTVRFNAYRTIYFDEEGLQNGAPDTQAAYQALQDKLNAGGFQPNPARSLIVGVVGLWRKGECPSEPSERMLVPLGQPILGAAPALVQGDNLVLDFANSVPEVDKILTKQVLGDPALSPAGQLTVVALDPATQKSTPLATIAYDQYNRAAYEATAGLITVPLKAGAGKLLETQVLQVNDNTGAALLTELPLRAIPQSPNLYMDQGDDVTATFQVYQRGAPLKAKTTLTLYCVDVRGNILGTNTVETDDQGVLSVPLTNLGNDGPGGLVVSYVPGFTGPDMPIGGINPFVNTFMFVRIRPADQNTAQLPPTWDNVYTNVLANWNAMAPCMDNWLNLKDPVQIRAYAAILKRLTDPANFESYRFMPITRDMSAGERTLLYNFLDAPTVTPLAAAETAGNAGSDKRDFNALSRSLRTV